LIEDEFASRQVSAYRPLASVGLNSSPSGGGGSGTTGLCHPHPTLKVPNLQNATHFMDNMDVGTLWKSMVLLHSFAQRDQIDLRIGAKENSMGITHINAIEEGFLESSSL
jgi:hypothetical protein